jgi:hypothetical protein
VDGRCRLVDDGEALDDLVHGLALFGLSPSARLRVLNVALDEVEKTDAEMSQDREITMLLNARGDGVQELAVLWLR